VGWLIDPIEKSVIIYRPATSPNTSPSPPPSRAPAPSPGLNSSWQGFGNELQAPGLPGALIIFRLGADQRPVEWAKRECVVFLIFAR